MRIWIFEDSQEDADRLQDALQTLLKQAGIVPELELYSSYQIPEGEDASLAFIDVELQEKSGLDLASALKKRSPNLVTVLMSAFPHYSIDGYKTGAVRFLPKPVTLASLQTSLDREFLSSLTEDPVLFSRQFPGGSLKVSYIAYVEFTDRHTEAHLASGRVLTCSWSLREWISLTEGYSFSQCYKSLLVNLAFVEDIDLPEMTILLKTHEKLPLSRHYRRQFSEDYRFWLCSHL